MDPLLILVVGMAVVIGGVLVLRLHAFLALMLGAVVVASLTPTEAIQRHAYLQAKRTQSEEQAKKTAVAAGERKLGDRLADGLGRTAAGIGILIAMASIIGRCLLESGAADRIVRSMMRAVGEGRAAVAFLMGGFVLGIPVFFDTVFLLMMPLARAAFRRSGKNYLLFVLAIVAGGTMTHSLVPPTPGPLFVAEVMNVELGVMILGGLIVGIFTSTAGYFFARWANRRLNLQPDGFEDEAVDKPDHVLPPLWFSLLPILLPVVLISAASIAEQTTKARILSEIEATTPPEARKGAVNAAFSAEVSESPALRWVLLLGDKNLAISLAAAVALLLLVRSRDRSTNVPRTVQDALSEAGVIILITSAGGAFGSVLQQTGIGERIQQLAAAWDMNILILGFLVSVLVRTAQGSATVAMITSAGIFAGAADPAQLACHPVYLALAIGCGSKPFAWMNDSGFWVICKTSGIGERNGLRTVTPMSAVMGFTGIAVILVGAKLFPLI